VQTLADLADPAIRRIAIANPDHAPYGRAAKEALQGAGLWDGLQERLVLAENVLQALQFADSGNADVALVARSLSVEGEGRWVLVPADSHKPIEQMSAVVSGSPEKEWARRFVEFVNGPEGRMIMRAHGFLLPGEADPGD
jgi:molybdate transport system substrate-binding protein